MPELESSESLQQILNRTEVCTEASETPKEKDPQVTVCTNTADHVGDLAMPLVDDSPVDVDTNHSQVESSKFNISDGPAMNKVELATNENPSYVSTFIVVAQLTLFSIIRFLWYVVRVKNCVCYLYAEFL